jgi:hypothetical protein
MCTYMSVCDIFGIPGWLQANTSASCLFASVIMCKREGIVQDNEHSVQFQADSQNQSISSMFSSFKSAVVEVSVRRAIDSNARSQNFFCGSIGAPTCWSQLCTLSSDPKQLFDSTQDQLQLETICIRICLRVGHATGGLFPLDMHLLCITSNAHAAHMCSIPRGQMHTCIFTKAVTNRVLVDRLVA